MSKCDKCGKTHGKELKWLYKGGVAYINDPVLQSCIVFQNLNKERTGPMSIECKEFMDKLKKIRRDK